MSIVSIVPTFYLDEPDHNQRNKPRLDILVSFNDGITVRYHPKADPIWSSTQQPTEAMRKRYDLRAKLSSKIYLHALNASSKRCRAMILHWRFYTLLWEHRNQRTMTLFLHSESYAVYFPTWTRERCSSFYTKHTCKWNARTCN